MSGDTWQAMCPHVINGMKISLLRGGGTKRKGRKKERERKERKRRKREKRKSTFIQSELVGPISKVCIFDKGYAPRGRVSFYFGLFSTIRAVGLCLCPKGLFGRISKYGNAALF